MGNKLDDRPYLVLFPILVYPFKTPFAVIAKTLVVSVYTLVGVGFSHSNDDFINSKHCVCDILASSFGNKTIAYSTHDQ
jgi:hypothetical protein